jgi:hypothetical protein
MDAVSGIFKPPHLLARNCLKLALQALWFESSVNFVQQACRDQKLACFTSNLVHEKNFKVDLRLTNHFRGFVILSFFVSLEARKKDKGGGYLLMSALMMGKCFVVFFKFRVRLTQKSVVWINM